MPKDFGWYGKTGEVPVEPAGTLVMPAIGAHDPTADLANAQLAFGGNTVEVGQYSVASSAENELTITNNSDAAWPTLGDFYVYAPSTLTAASVGEDFETLQATVADHEARITALESAPVADEEDWVDDDDAESSSRKKVAKKGRK